MTDILEFGVQECIIANGPQQMRITKAKGLKPLATKAEGNIITTLNN